MPPGVDSPSTISRNEVGFEYKKGFKNPLLQKQNKKKLKIKKQKKLNPKSERYLKKKKIYVKCMFKRRE